MSYFNHAFKKAFIATANTPFTGLALGQLGTPGNIPAKGQVLDCTANCWNSEQMLSTCTCWWFNLYK
jgi:hypothetical protein